jgi:hypothetical protein
MTLEQVNAVSHPTTLPIAFSLVHQVLIEDGSVVFMGGPPPQFNDDWARDIGLAIVNDGKEKSVEEMMHQRVGDFEALQAFQRLVFDATENYATSIEPSSFSEVIVRAPYGATIANTFSARVGGDAGITRSDALECWIYQHALRHMGEIEHARSLVGLRGMTS